MVGRFIGHDGRQKNAPAVRFGNIAMMPHEAITSPHGIEQESFLVEVRSLPGYSGSAVFLYSPCAMNDMSVCRFGMDKASSQPEFGVVNTTPEDEKRFKRALSVAFSPKGPYLLGIDWCHLHNRHSVRDREGVAIGTVQENTGMAGVIPAWKIKEVLDLEELAMARKRDEKTMEEQFSSKPR